MPTYQVTDPVTGQQLKLTGDSPPTEDELKQIFAQQEGGQDGISGIVEPDGAGIPAVRTDQPSVAGLEQEEGFPGAGIIEPAATLVSGALAEPIAGLAGIAGMIGAKSPEGAPRAGAEAVEAAREALTFEPRTEAGKEGLQAVGEVLKPVGEALQAAETFLGDETFKATNSPALAAAATTIPTAIIEGIGFASAKGVIKGAAKTKQAARSKEVRRAVVDASPDIDQIKSTSRAVYKELDDSGVTIQSEPINGLVKKIESKLMKEGLDPDLTPKSHALVKRLNNEINTKSLSEFDTLRKVAQNAAGSLDPSDARLGSIVIDEIDSFLDDVPVKGEKAGAKYRVARELWGRARRSEIINEAFEKAGLQASGFENGLVVQFRQILSNKKRSRYFKPEEISAMKDVVKGTTPSNIAKLVGRFGFSEGHATNLIGGALGAGAGAQLLGAPGAVLVPVIGQVSRKLAQKLTLKGAKFADAVIRAGDNAEDIAKVYISKVPKAQRSADELSELLLRPDVALDKLTSKAKLIKEASEIAKGRRILNAVVATAAAGAPGAIKEIEAQ